MNILGSPLLILLHLMAFVMGIACIPLLAFIVGKSTPSKIASPIANSVFTVALAGRSRWEFNQTEQGHYELEPATQAYEPESYWIRWAMSQVAITATLSQAAFGSLARDLQAVHDASEPEPNITGKRCDANLSRGGQDWFLDLKEAGSAYWVPIGQKLSELQGAAGLDLGEDAIRQALKEYGGDTSQYSSKMMYAGYLTFSVLGFGMGYIIAF